MSPAWLFSTLETILINVNFLVPLSTEGFHIFIWIVLVDLMRTFYTLLSRREMPFCFMPTLVVYVYSLHLVTIASIILF